MNRQQRIQTTLTVVPIGLMFFFLLSAFFTSSLWASEVVVVAFGDSTTASRGKLEVYSDLLKAEFLQSKVKAKIINAGVGGNTTTQARSRFETDVLAKHPNLVIIQFGINDAAVDVWKNPPATKSRVSLKEYKENVRFFTQKLKSKKSQIILMTPNPLRWRQKTKQLYGKAPYAPNDEEGFNVLLVQYAKAVRQIGKEESVLVVDVYSAFQNYGIKQGQNVDDLLLDGMHPNNKGHQIVFELLKDTMPFKKIFSIPTPQLSR